MCPVSSVHHRHCMDLWVPPQPLRGHAESFLLFSICWLVQHRVAERNAWLRKGSAYIEGERERNRLAGNPLTAEERIRPNRWQALLDARPTSFNPQDHSAVQFNAGVFSWLFMGIRNVPLHLPPLADESPVVRLRATCRAWRKRLDRLPCCNCGLLLPPAYFHHDHTFYRAGNFGQLPCTSCHSLCIHHLSCTSCERQGERCYSSSDSTNDTTSDSD